MLIGAVWSRELICCVVEHCEGGTMHEVLEGSTRFKWEKEKLRWVVQICRGMEYLHSSVFLNPSKGNAYQEGIIHRDLTTANVRLSANLETCKVGNFGEARVVSEGTMTMVGGDFSMAPEIFTGDRYDLKSDVWSFGILLAEMCQVGSIQDLLLGAAIARQGVGKGKGKGGNLKKKGFSLSRLKNMLYGGHLSPIYALSENDLPPCWQKLVVRCLELNSERRPEFKEILAICEGEICDEMAKQRLKGGETGERGGGERGGAERALAEMEAERALEKQGNLDKLEEIKMEMRVYNKMRDEELSKAGVAAQEKLKFRMLEMKKKRNEKEQEKEKEGNRKDEEKKQHEKKEEREAGEVPDLWSALLGTR